MYIIYFLIVVLMFLINNFIELAISKVARRRILTQEKITLEGMERYYPLISGLTVFIGWSALYFGVINMTHGPHNLKCWLMPSTIVSIYYWFIAYSRLKRLSSRR